MSGTTEITRGPIDSDNNEPYPLLAKVVSHLDPKYMGSLEVELLRQAGNDDKSEGQLRIVKYASPFMGVSDVEYCSMENVYDGTQKSYGFWMVPPDVGSTVIVIFIDGDPKKGYWLACVPDLSMNFMTPGYAATSFVENGIEERVPVGEYNKKLQTSIPKDTTRTKKPQHPFAEIFKAQGLILDDIRGITTSSARRDIPSAVYGISTPGPIDKNGPKGKVGKKEHEIVRGPVSRLGGSSFVMDDGDDKFERKTKASEGPPDYASVEEGEKGDAKIPHNELIRIRTRTGHQILLHNSEDLIYIGNARGTAWIELTSDGKMDVFCEDSISIHTKQDFNLRADRDINFEAGRNFNIRVLEEMHTQVIKDHILMVDGNHKVKVVQKVDMTYEQEYKHKVMGAVDFYHTNNFKHYVAGNNDLSIGGYYYQTSGGANETRAAAIIETGGVIHMNGPGAAQATQAQEAEKPLVLKTYSVPDQEGATLFETIMRRVPIMEPWPHHENLDPLEFKPEKTDRDIDGRYEDNSDFLLTPEFFKKYTTKVDTFAKTRKE
jgi:hypothetical protein